LVNYFTLQSCPLQQVIY